MKLKTICETHAMVVEDHAKGLAEINNYTEHRLGTVHN